MGRIPVHVILNPLSAEKQHNDPAETILRELGDQKFEVSFFTTSEKGEAAAVSGEAVRRRVPVIVAAGGDGTVNEVGSAIVGSECALGIIPIGSGNGLARSMGIPLSVKKSAGVISRMKSRWIDTGTVNGMPFFSVAGTGFDARVANRYNESKKRGFFTYLYVIVSEMFRYRTRNFELDIDGTRMNRRAFLITVSNSGQYGYNTVIAPGAELDDGLLDLVIIKDLSFFRIPLMGYRLMSGTINKANATETYQGRSIKITRERGKRINLDGESVRMGKALTIEVVPSSLKLITP